ncbi:MAG: hypothetical protein O3A00_07905, partial [Planctomycetota bacterium]|nr:hypothetical protein [Planctomycetota bacterium]
VATTPLDLTPGDYSVWVKAINVNGTHIWSREHTFTADFGVVAMVDESSVEGREFAVSDVSEPVVVAKSDELPALADLGLKLALEVSAIEALVFTTEQSQAGDVDAEESSITPTAAATSNQKIDIVGETESWQSHEIEQLDLLFHDPTLNCPMEAQLIRG